MIIVILSEQMGSVLVQLKAWIENNNFGAHLPVEVRFAKGDDAMLSLSYQRDTCFINIPMYM